MEASITDTVESERLPTMAMLRDSSERFKTSAYIAFQEISKFGEKRFLNFFTTTIPRDLIWD